MEKQEKNTSKKASSALKVSAIIVGIINIGLSFVNGAFKYKNVSSPDVFSEFLGYIFGIIILPLIVVAIFNIWKKFRNNKSRYKIFLICSLILSLSLLSSCTKNLNDSVIKEEPLIEEESPATENFQPEQLEEEINLEDKKKTEKKNEKLGLEEKELLTGKVKIFLPESFTVMSEEMMELKYPSERRPTLAYANEDYSINIAFNHTQNKVKDGQIPEYKREIKKAFENLYPSAAWFEDKVVKNNGRNIGVFELLTPAVDAEIYNLMSFSELEGRLFLVSFNCTEEQMEEWEPIAKRIIESLKVK